MPLRNSEDNPNIVVAGWENQHGTYHSVYDSDGDKVGRGPTDGSLESAERVVLYDTESDRFFTIDGGLFPDYGIDEAIDDDKDKYGEA
jgi:hypothetical protein